MLFLTFYFSPLSPILMIKASGLSTEPSEIRRRKDSLSLKLLMQLTLGFWLLGQLEQKRKTITLSSSSNKSNLKTTNLISTNRFFKTRIQISKLKISINTNPRCQMKPQESKVCKRSPKTKEIQISILNHQGILWLILRVWEYQEIILHKKLKGILFNLEHQVGSIQLAK